jgi:hypothetical protein
MHLLRHCRRLLTDADSLTERARALKRGQTGILRVGATPQTIESLLVNSRRAGSYGHCQPASHNPMPNINVTTRMMMQAKSERLSGLIIRSPSGPRLN